MINLYDSRETGFLTNGIAVLDNIVKSATIKEKLNGEYTLELELLKDRNNKYKLLKEFCIVKAYNQLFRLYSQENIQDTTISIKAVLHHITTDLGLDCHQDTRVVDADCATALKKLITDTRFIVDTDIPSTVKATAYFVEESPLEGLIKKVAPRWGGYVLRDNFNIGVYKDVGCKSELSIAFRKNIKGFTQKIDYSELATKIMPKGKEGIKISSVNKGSAWLVSPNVNKYFKPIAKIVHFEDAETPADLKKVALEKLETLDKPKIEFTVDMVDLMQVAEYKRFKGDLESLTLGDTVTVKHEAFDLDLTARVVGVEIDALAERTTQLILGDYFQNFIEGSTAIIKKEVKEGIGKELTHVNDNINKVYTEVNQNVTTIAQEMTTTKDTVSQLETETTTKLTDMRDTVVKVNESCDALNVVADEYKEGKLEGKTYKFTGEGFVIGGVDGAKAQHTEQFSKWEHSDGEYTKIGAEGLERHSKNWNNGKAYHYYTYRGTVAGVESGKTVRVNFPAEFKGKDYEITWFAGNILPQEQGDLVFSANVELIQQNKAEGWADLKASLMVRNPAKESAPIWRGKLNIIYMGFL